MNDITYVKYKIVNNCKTRIDFWIEHTSLKNELFEGDEKKYLANGLKLPWKREHFGYNSVADR